MYTAIIVLTVVAAILLVLIVLAQNSKGGGLASNLSAGAQFGGVAEQKSKLENYTWGLVIAIAALSILACATGGKRVSNTEDSGVRNIINTQQPAQQSQTLQLGGSAE